MPFDAHQNLAIAAVAVAPSPASSGTTLTVAAGTGARFPAVPFQATVWAAAELPTPLTAEVVRVTARATDTLTITRAQEGTTARTIVAGDLIAATITVKALTDIESGTNFPQLGTTGNLVFSGSASPLIQTNTADGADNATLYLTGAGGFAPGRGPYMFLSGNEVASAPGQIRFVLGDAPASIMEFSSAAATLGRIHKSGGFSWGHTTDPGAGRLSVGGPAGAFPSHITARFNPGLGEGGIAVGTTADTSGAILAAFWGAGNTLIGSIGVTSGPGVAYNTASDQRLKDDQGVASRAGSADVLRETVVHDFLWKVDGTPGRGVFAQEAVAVAPFAIFVGTDEVDAEGHLVKPWGVDYSKYVPDLLVGWQAHEAQVVALEAQVATLEARLAALEAALAARG
jgi:hypothetical protein